MHVHVNLEYKASPSNFNWLNQLEAVRLRGVQVLMLNYKCI